MGPRVVLFILLLLALSSLARGFSQRLVRTKASLSPHAQQWIDESLHYYNRIARGTPKEQWESPEHIAMAMRTYFAHTKVKGGKSYAAEKIYRRLMEEMTATNGSRDKEHEHHHHCDGRHHHDCNSDLGRLAVPTLLLSLLLQREQRFDDARLVFESFYQIVVKLLDNGTVQCPCSARVLQAFALFEMKQDNQLRALEIVALAVRLDGKIRPVLRWKQFRDAIELRRRLSSGRLAP